VFEVQDGIRVRQFRASPVRSAERGKGKATTAAAGRVGCAATVSRPPGLVSIRAWRPYSTTGTALLPWQFRRAEFLAGRTRDAFRGTRGKGRKLPTPRQEPTDRDLVNTADVCGWRAVPGPRRTRPRMSWGLPRVSARSRDLALCGGGRVGGTTDYCGRLGSRSRRGARPFSTRPPLPGTTRLLVVPFPGSQGDHRIVGRADQRPGRGQHGGSVPRPARPHRRGADVDPRRPGLNGSKGSGRACRTASPPCTPPEREGVPHERDLTTATCASGQPR
jgi:hypothetical protein